MYSEFENIGARAGGYGVSSIDLEIGRDEDEPGDLARHRS